MQYAMDNPRRSTHVLRKLFKSSGKNLGTKQNSSGTGEEIPIQPIQSSVVIGLADSNVIPSPVEGDLKNLSYTEPAVRASNTTNNNEATDDPSTIFASISETIVTVNADKMTTGIEENTYETEVENIADTLTSGTTKITAASTEIYYDTTGSTDSEPVKFTTSAVEEVISTTHVNLKGTSLEFATTVTTDEPSTATHISISGRTNYTEADIFPSSSNAYTTSTDETDHGTSQSSSGSTGTLFQSTSSRTISSDMNTSIAQSSQFTSERSATDENTAITTASDTITESNTENTSETTEVVTETVFSTKDSARTAPMSTLPESETTTPTTASDTITDSNTESMSETTEVITEAVFSTKGSTGPVPILESTVPESEATSSRAIDITVESATHGISTTEPTIATSANTEQLPATMTPAESTSTSTKVTSNNPPDMKTTTEISGSSSSEPDRVVTTSTGTISTVPGSTEMTLEKTTEYFVTFEASSSSQVLVNATDQEPPAETPAGPDVLVIVLASVASLAVLLLILLLIYIFWNRSKNKKRHRSQNGSSRRDHRSRKKHQMEMTPKGLQWNPSLRQLTPSEVSVTRTIIGEGRFGPVCEGYLVTSPSKIVKVACKSLAEDSCDEDKVGFSRQIELYRTVSGHPNLPTLIGVLTTTDSFVFGVFEFCSTGSLWSVLRLISDGSGKYKDVRSLEGLLGLAMGVANGMRHLSSRGIVHRELCAINVLLTEDLSPKIAALNASDTPRAIYKAWSAPEALEDNIHTLMSDVWSFGVLLWEIITLGETPYEDIAPQDLLRHLTRGYRMSKPYGCLQAVYDLMLSCWHEQPSYRPTFVVITESIKRILRDDRLLKENLI